MRQHPLAYHSDAMHNILEVTSFWGRCWYITAVVSRAKEWNGPTKPQRLNYTIATITLNPKPFQTLNSGSTKTWSSSNYERQTRAYPSPIRVASPENFAPWRQNSLNFWTSEPWAVRAWTLPCQQNWNGRAQKRKRPREASWSVLLNDYAIAPSSGGAVRRLCNTVAKAGRCAASFAVVRGRATAAFWRRSKLGRAEESFASWCSLSDLWRWWSQQSIITKCSRRQALTSSPLPSLRGRWRDAFPRPSRHPKADDIYAFMDFKCGHW
jgi:hypothetical protein